MTISKQTKVMSVIVIVCVLFIMIGSMTTVFGLTTYEDVESETIYNNWVNNSLQYSDDFGEDTHLVIFTFLFNNDTYTYYYYSNSDNMHVIADDNVAFVNNGPVAIFMKHGGYTVNGEWKSTGNFQTYTITNGIPKIAFSNDKNLVPSLTGRVILPTHTDASWYNLEGFLGNYIDFFFHDLFDVSTFNLHMYQTKTFGDELINTWYFDDSTNYWRFDTSDPYWLTYTMNKDDIYFKVTFNYDDESTEEIETKLPDISPPTPTEVIKPRFDMTFTSQGLALTTNYGNEYHIDLNAYTLGLGSKTTRMELVNDNFVFTEDIQQVIYETSQRPFGPLNWWELEIKSTDGTIIYGHYSINTDTFDDTDTVTFTIDSDVPTYGDIITDEDNVTELTPNDISLETAVENLQQLIEQVQDVQLMINMLMNMFVGLPLVTNILIGVGSVIAVIVLVAIVKVIRGM